MSREVHPIPDAPAGWTPEQRIHHLEVQLARLWDAVWWLSLPDDERRRYEAEGFKHPIEKFYETVD